MRSVCKKFTKRNFAMTCEKIRNFIKNHRIDIAVVASLIALSLAILLVTALTKTEGAYAEISVNGSIVGKYPLSLDGSYSLNGGTNTLTIEGGQAYMSYSSCPDHTCEIKGKIKFVGQTIVCLPNRITVTVIGDSDTSVDFVS